MGQAGFRSLIIKDMQLETWKFLSDAGRTARQERFFGEKGAAPQERSSIRSSAATEERRPTGVSMAGNPPAEPGVSKNKDAG